MCQRGSKEGVKASCLMTVFGLSDQIIFPVRQCDCNAHLVILESTLYFS